MLHSRAKLCARKWRRGLRGLPSGSIRSVPTKMESATVIAISEPLYAAWHAAFTFPELLNI